MTELSSTERVLRVLRRQEPDRVPHFEWLVDRRVREALVPGCRDHNDFAVRMGHDAVLVAPDVGKTRVSADSWRSEWGYVVRKTAEEHGVEVESPIRTVADLERYVPPDPHAPGRYAAVENAVREFKGIKAIGVHLNDVFSIPRYLLGMEGLLLAVVADPDLVRHLVDMSVDINIEMAREAAGLGVDFVWTGDDYAYNDGPLVSPAHFRELFYPGLCRVMRGFREAGLPVIKHTDGDLTLLLDMILDAGIDCLDPVDPQAGMNLARLKADLGTRVALKGNVDCAAVLSFGTEDDVVRDTVRALREGGPGGGYILSSSNSIHSGVIPANYAAMLRTWERHRDYPLRL